MTPEVFESTLRSLVRQTPFQPFFIEMEGEQKIVILDPEKLAFGSGGGAGYFHESDIFLIDCERVVQIKPVPAKGN